MSRTIQFVFNGEFGWECIHWQAYCRKRAKDFDKAYILSVNEGSYPLYADFAEWGLQRTNVTECYQKDQRRAFEYQEFIRFPLNSAIEYDKEFAERIGYSDILIHARNDKNNNKNTSLEKWIEIAAILSANNCSISCIGTKALHVPGTTNKLNISLKDVFELMAKAKCIIGPSSGPMHLAALCGCPAVVWGDERTRHGKPLSHRYYESWNPFKTPVEFIETDLDWNPEPREVINRVGVFL